MIEDIITYADDVSLDSKSRESLENFASWWGERRSPESDLPFPDVVDTRSYLLHLRLKGTGCAAIDHGLSVMDRFYAWLKEAEVRNFRDGRDPIDDIIVLAFRRDL